VRAKNTNTKKGKAIRRREEKREAGPRGEGVRGEARSRPQEADGVPSAQLARLWLKKYCAKARADAGSECGETEERQSAWREKGREAPCGRGGVWRGKKKREEIETLTGTTCGGKSRAAFLARKPLPLVPPREEGPDFFELVKQGCAIVYYSLVVCALCIVFSDGDLSRRRRGAGTPREHSNEMGFQVDPLCNLGRARFTGSFFLGKCSAGCFLFSPGTRTTSAPQSPRRRRPKAEAETQAAGKRLRKSSSLERFLERVDADVSPEVPRFRPSAMRGGSWKNGFCAERRFFGCGEAKIRNKPANKAGKKLELKGRQSAAACVE